MFLKRNVRFCASVIQKRFQKTIAEVQNSNAQILQELKGPVFKNAKYFPDRIAIRDHTTNYSYANIFLSANELSREISHILDGKRNERVLFLCENDVNYVITLWAIWLSGQIAVPLSPLHPKNMLLYYANDTSSKLLISTSKFSNVMERVAKNTHSKLYILDDRLKLNCTQMNTSNLSDLEGNLNNCFYDKSDAMILYTSGTTGSPKGVILTHKNLTSQITTLLDAWRFSKEDVLLHTLPLHHVHGIVNALLCPLYIGAKTMMLKKFDANSVWSYMLGVNAMPDDRKISIFMAVPTIYAKLLDEYDRVFSSDEKMTEYIKNTLKSKIRLMVSGSASLPVPLFERWYKISGHKLLERYGMTEIGMALSNLYNSDREPGYVGVPLPNVSVAISEPETNKIYMESSNFDNNISVKMNFVNEGNLCGELLVKSDSVFRGYFNRNAPTKLDGWFRTGDMCEYCAEKQKFRLLGRLDGDIIKTGGYKVSALEIETHLMAHYDVIECAVTGISDRRYGSKVAAIVVIKNDSSTTVDDLVGFCKIRMPRYWVPSEWKIVDFLPRNTMGKVNKKQLARDLFKRC